MTKVLTEPRSIRIKGRSFLAVVLTPDPPFDDWLVRLDDLAARSAGFFLGRPVVLDVSDIEIDKPQLKALIAELAYQPPTIKMFFFSKLSSSSHRRCTLRWFRVKPAESKNAPFLVLMSSASCTSGRSWNKLTNDANRPS